MRCESRVTFTNECLRPFNHWSKKKMMDEDDPYYAVFVDGVEIVRGSSVVGDVSTNFATLRNCPEYVSAELSEDVSAELSEAATTPASPEIMETSVSGTRFLFSPIDACLDPAENSHSIGKIKQCLEGCALLPKCIGFLALGDGCTFSFGVPAECNGE